MQKISEVLAKKSTRQNEGSTHNVNVSSNSSNGNVGDEYSKNESRTKVEDSMTRVNQYAKHLAHELQDQKSLTYYKLLVREHGEGVLFEVLAIVMDSLKRGKVRNSASYFVGILAAKGLRVKFVDQ
jgi:hypothetical protein